MLACLLVLGCLAFPPTAPAQQQPEPTAAAQHAATQAAPANPADATERQENATERQNENDAYRHSASVRAIGRMLGLGPESAARLFEILNFTVLAIAVLWFAIKVLPRTLRARGQRIAARLTEARSATADADTRLKSVEERLGRLDQEIASLRTQFDADAKRDEAHLREQLEEDKKKIIAAAEQEIAAAGAHAQRDLRQYAAALAIEQAVRSLKLTPEDDRALIENFAATLGSRRDHN